MPKKNRKNRKRASKGPPDDLGDTPTTNAGNLLNKTEDSSQLQASQGPPDDLGDIPTTNAGNLLNKTDDSPQLQASQGPPDDLGDIPTTNAGNLLNKTDDSPQRQESTDTNPESHAAEGAYIQREEYDEVTESADNIELDTFKTVIDKAWGKLVDYMNPYPILDSSVFDHRETRDIMEEKTTSEKNRCILKKFRPKGAVGYKSLMKCLMDTKQTLLVRLLECTEKGKDTSLLEKQLQDEVVKTTHNVIKGGRNTEVTVENKFIGKYMQIGRHENIIQDNSTKSSRLPEDTNSDDSAGFDSDESNSSLIGAVSAIDLHHSDVKEKMKSTNIFSGQNIKVNFNISTSDQTQKEEYANPQSVKEFLETVEYFDEEKSQYILVADRLTNIDNLDAFALVSWIAVFDFDPESRYSGLLSYCENSIEKRRSLHVGSWQDDKCSFIDHSLYWFGLKGCYDKVETRIETDYYGWKKKIKSSFAHQLNQLKLFGNQYTNFTVVVLWPSNSSNYKHIRYVLDEISELLSPSRKIIVTEDTSKKSKEGKSVLNLLDDFKLISLGIPELCRIILNVCTPHPSGNQTFYQLPTADNTNDPNINAGQAQWLKEDLDVLYSKNTTGTKIDKPGMEKEQDTFFKGGTLPWAWWYQAGPGAIDIQRDIAEELIMHIKTRHIQPCRSGNVTIFHNPGSGGTTLAQRVLWMLKGDAPCVQIKHRYGSLINDIEEKIVFLSGRTRMPILVLVDGGDEQKVEYAQRHLGGSCCVIILYVKRYHAKIDGNKRNLSLGRFWLNSKLSENEAVNLSMLYKAQCTNARQRRNIDDLVKEVQRNKGRSLFDFGFAMHSYKYKGIESYVQGYLKLDRNEELEPWQKALAYLSLVYYYGQTSLPCKFVASIIDPENGYENTFSDFKDEMKEFMVHDVQDRRKHVVRISHFYIAKEILDQVLVYPMTIHRQPSPFLSPESKRKMTQFAVEFIQIAGVLNQNEPSTNISYIMTRTFILRDNKAVGENETEVAQKKQKFSQILEDVCSSRPFTERFDIYQTLTNSFPQEAQFRAHLGRLYTHCRPNQLELAEQCFKEAIEICENEVIGMKRDDISYSKKMDFMHIYHMYGNMILNSVSDTTGKYPFDNFKKHNAPSLREMIGLLSDVKRACELFQKSREITPIGCEESFGYISEIHIRLMFCNYVREKHCDKKDIIRFAEENKGDIGHFVNECIMRIDELFWSCYTDVEQENIDKNVIKCQKWYADLFKVVSGHFVFSLTHEDTMSRRLKIAKLKMKYCLPDSFGILEHVNDCEDISVIVRCLEKNFEDYEIRSRDFDISHKSMDMDYREWLFAIRHPLFEETYSIQKVLQQVQMWHDHLHTPNSLFYMFVLKSLLGMRNRDSDGDTALLRDAKNCKDEMLKRLKLVPKPRYPREWLGKPDNNIRRLVSGRRFFGQIEGRCVKSIDFEQLEIQKGSIAGPNDSPAGGYIYLDLGTSNRLPVKVFFIPARAKGNLKGASFVSKRVEFVIGFSVSHGYEAFNVKLIEHQKCPKCKQNVERKSFDRLISCPRCCIEFECIGPESKQSKDINQ